MLLKQAIRNAAVPHEDEVDKGQNGNRARKFEVQPVENEIFCRLICQKDQNSDKDAEAAPTLPFRRLTTFLSLSHAHGPAILALLARRAG